ncbi:MAG: Fic family protein [Solirubrobacteraceae bacterium]
MSSGAAPLGHYERRQWQANLGAPTRKHRRGGFYETFIPAPIASHSFQLDDQAVAALSGAAKALSELNSSPPRLASLESLARNLLRSEAVASSRIEGLVLSQKRLARAAYRPDGRASGDRRAAEVLANVQAMEDAIALGGSVNPLRVADIEEIHRTLLRFTFDDIAGVLRTSQNWIGGSDYHPLDATFVPPPPELVKPALEDLCDFARREDVAPVAQAAIAHAQFETIHPFADGNGRVGRALIYTILRRRDEIPRYIPPISLVLAAEPKAYISGLEDYRSGRVSDWCALFASATRRAAEEAGELSRRIELLQQTWIERLGNPRRDSAVRELIAALPAQPVIDVPAGQQLSGKSHVAVGNALSALETVGVLRRLNEKKWGRLWECEALLSLIDDFERQLSP